MFASTRLMCYGRLRAKIRALSAKLSMENSNQSKRPCQYGTNKYIQYQPGGINSKLIICAPHGGDLRPESMPNRDEHPNSVQQGGTQRVATIKDFYTKEIALLLTKEIVNLIGEDYAPYLIVCNLHRVKMDANRNIKEATMESVEAATAYKEYHGYINIAKEKIGTGLLLDIHGQSHPEEWVELGYMISKADLIADSLRAESCSMRSLVKSSTFGIEELIRGSCSLGNYLQNEGINCIPSPINRKTAGNYFNGAYTTFVHGSIKNGTIDSIQIETHRKYRNQEKATEYTKSLAKAIVTFIKKHYS